MARAAVNVGMCLVACWLAAAAGAAQVEMKTEQWANHDDAFGKFNERIVAGNLRNLLARKGVRCTSNGGLGAGAVRFLTDGYAGERGGEGRAFVNGQPSVITFYLGQPKPIHEVGIFTFNIDARANQDFEIRFASNAQAPGKEPTFPDKPHFTSGDKVIGPNAGGFHTRFVAKGGGPVLPGKVDWVQLRIWRTYNVKAGHPARTTTPSGGSCYIELELYGAPDDVVRLTAEDIARRQAIREAPKQPGYEKKATWQETMVAAREAMVEWETLHDRLALPDMGGTLGPWHVLGPLPANSREAAQLSRQRTIDLAKPVPLKDRTPLAWQALAAVEDGRMIDLAKLLKARKGDVVFLCRTLAVEQQFDRRNPFSCGVGLGAGTIKLLPRGHTLRDRRTNPPCTPNQRTWGLSVGPGKYQVLARVPVANDGTCRFWFMPQPAASRPGAGSQRTRLGRRHALFGRLKRDFAAPADQTRLTWEQLDRIWFTRRYVIMAHYEQYLTDWVPGDPAFLAEQYHAAVERRLGKLAADLAVADAATRAKVERWLPGFKAAEAPQEVAAARARYYALATVQEALAVSHRLESMRLAIGDQRDTFGPRYPKANAYLARVAELRGRMAGVWPRALAAEADALDAVLAAREAAVQAAKDILLANPLLDFDKLLLARGGPSFAANWGGANRLGSEIVVLSPVKPDGEVTPLYRLPSGSLSNFDLSFDAKKILFADGRHIYEIGSDGKNPRQITRQSDPHVYHWDPIHLPSGKILFLSTACEQCIPCVGGWYVANIHVMDPDGTHERRLTYDQDHNWDPCLLNNGRVVYTRWEYTDTPHYFDRLLFHMNPDGTEQMEYYGSNSYWPNAMYWARPIPGHPTRISCVVSGHHGVARQGELLLLDPAKGRHEADGVVQRIPGRARKVEPIIKDELVLESWPRFATPYPLAEPGTHLGAGKYFLATVRLTPHSPWGLYLVDVFDNMTPLLMGGYSMPTPLRPRPRPPVVPSKVDTRRKDGVVYMANVYEGGGLEGYPRGSIKALRIGSHHYRYGGNSDTRASSYEGGWDVKRILGTVPVHPDGSAYFRVPANTPIFVQPLDAEGKAQQLMRSWFTAMPGEVLSCVGCHERQNTVPPNTFAEALKHPPAAIAPWHGPTRGFSFDREVQPVLDRRCVGCHNGQPRNDGRALPDFRAKRLHHDFKGTYSPAYTALARTVRRAGYEADYHLARPAEFEADTSPLVQRLKKGHHHVRLTPDEWGRLYAWIDFNVPYAANWRESHRPPTDEQVARRAKYKKLHANLDDHDEDPLPLPPIARFEPPPPEPPRPAPTKLDGWPLSPEQAARLQKATGLAKLTVDLGEGVAMALVPVPAGRFVMGDVGGFPDEFPEAVVAIDRPFYLGQLEVTNAQYARFDPNHDSAYIDARSKDRYTRGYPVNAPDQPVVRITWHQAMAFCRWLSKRTGTRCTLPTEAEWEWACRAGTATPWAFGAKTEGVRDVANVSDASLRGWNWGRVEPGYSDGAQFSAAGGRYKPNAWGLHDLHGNVAEWTLSAYLPYPYVASDGRNRPASAEPRVVRGGSWNDRFRFARSASRWRYPPHRPVYNVGFRVVCHTTQLATR